MLRISPTTELPDDYVTETMAILAKRGTGKSNAAVVLAEEMYAAGYQWVAIDPKGDWYGIRSAGDGTEEGLPIPVIGGMHGDIPLDPNGGAALARFIVKHGVTCVLDVSDFDSKAEQIRFVTAFGAELFKLLRKSPRPLHLFLEEADEFLPQVVGKQGEPAMVGIYSKITKQGRAFGFGVTLITQRSASLNKNALSQTGTLVLFRTTSPHDRDAVMRWAEHEDNAKDVSASLSKLEPGESWILDHHGARQVRWRRRHTFDSGATPKVGVDSFTAGPDRTAPVDLEALAEQMADAIEAARQDDPDFLRERIRDLEAQLAVRPAAEPEVVEVAVLDPELVDRICAAAGTLDVVIETEDARRADWAETVAGLRSSFGDLIDAIEHPPSQFAFPPDDIPERPAPASQPPAPKRSTAPPVEGTAKLSKAEKAILTVLVQHPAGRTKSQLAFLSGYSVKSSSLANALGTLRGLGLVTERGEPIMALDGAAEALGDVAPLPTGPALLEHWRSRLGKAEKEILDVMIAARGDVSRDYICEMTPSHYSPTSSSTANALGTLRRLELVEGWHVHPDFLAAIR